jgi:hypothetical protein
VIGIAPALAECASQARLSRKRLGKTGFLPRTPACCRHPRRASDRAEGRALPRADQARPDLPVRAPRGDIGPDGPAAPRLPSRPTRRRVRPELDHPKPAAEHPDPHRRPAARSARASSPSPATLLRRRLLAGRAAACSPTSPARRCCATSSGAARTSTPRPASAVFGVPRGPAPWRCAQGQDGQLRASSTGSRRSGSPTACASSRSEAQEFIDRYLERFPRRALHGRSPSRRRPSTATSRRLFGRRRQIPEIRAAQLADAQARRAPGVNTIIQARRPTSSGGHGSRA